VGQESHDFRAKNHVISSKSLIAFIATQVISSGSRVGRGVRTTRLGARSLKSCSPRSVVHHGGVYDHRVFVFSTRSMSNSASHCLNSTQMASRPQFVGPIGFASRSGDV